MNITEALGILEPLNFNLWGLSGNSNKPKRQALMSTLHGRKIPVAKCGITQIESDLHAALSVTGDTIRARELDFIDKARALLDANR